ARRREEVLRGREHREHLRHPRRELRGAALEGAVVVEAVRVIAGPDGVRVAPIRRAREREDHLLDLVTCPQLLEACLAHALALLLASPILPGGGRPVPGFLIRLAISAFGLWLAEHLLSGIRIDDTGTLIVAALLYGIVNAVIRPLAILLTLPLTVLT